MGHPPARTFALALTVLGLALTPGLAASPRPFWEAEATAQAGLEDFARGAEVALAAGFRNPAWGLGLRAAASYDGFLDSFRGLLGLALYLGPGLSFEAGWEYGITEAGFVESSHGVPVTLESAGLASRLGIRTCLLELGSLGGGRLRLLGRLEWSAYRIVSVAASGKTAEAVAKALAQDEGFAAGFRGGLVVSWSRP